MSEVEYEGHIEPEATSDYQWPAQAREDLLGLAELTEEAVLAVLAPHVAKDVAMAVEASYRRGYEAGRVAALSEPFQEPEIKEPVVELDKYSYYNEEGDDEYSPGEDA